MKNISRKTVILACLSIQILASSCRDKPQSTVFGSDGDDARIPYSETLLVAGSKGELAYVGTGESFSVQMLRGPGQQLRQLPQIQSFENKFYVTDLENLKIEILDPHAGSQATEVITLSKRIFDYEALPEELKYDQLRSAIARSEASDLFLTVTGTGEVYRKRSTEPGFSPWVDLRPTISSPFELRSMKIIDKLLYVQVSRYGRVDGSVLPSGLAVLDIRTGELLKFIELNGKFVDFSLEHDEERKRLWVVSAGSRQGEKGAIDLIDVDPSGPSFLTIMKTHSLGGFQGALALGHQFKGLFHIFHTSTPSFSTHMNHVLFGPSGTLDDFSKGETQGLDLTSAFESSDNLQTNSDRGLAAISFYCNHTPCPRGGGIYFFDGKSGLPLPKLHAAGKVPRNSQPKVTLPFLVVGFSFLKAE